MSKFYKFCNQRGVQEPVAIQDEVPVSRTNTEIDQPSMSASPRTADQDDYYQDDRICRPCQIRGCRCKSQGILKQFNQNLVSRSLSRCI